MKSPPASGPSTYYRPSLWYVELLSCSTKCRMFVGWRQCFPQVTVEHILCPCCGLFIFFFLIMISSEVVQSCPTLCNLHGLEPARLLCPWDFPGKSAGAGCHFLLQEIFPTQRLNPDLPHCRQMLYHLSHQGSPDF